MLPRTPRTDSESLGHPRQVPDGLDRELGDSKFALVVDADLAIRDTVRNISTATAFQPGRYMSLQSSAPYALLELRQLGLCQHGL